MKMLIVGANGLLGRHATEYFINNGVQIVRASHTNNADITLDLRTIPPESLLYQIPSDTSHALICSAISSIDHCVQHMDESFAFNVSNTIALLKLLFERGIIPIFCSTDLVFKGDEGNYCEDAPREPTTEYGRQKKLVEDFILTQNRPYIIIRLSKLYNAGADDTSPISQMLANLHNGQPIKAAIDQKICPTCVKDIPKALHQLLALKQYGVFHVTAGKSYSRYELAMLLATALEKTGLIIPCSISDFSFLQPRPQNNSLDVAKLRSTAAITLAAMEDMLPALLSEFQSHAAIEPDGMMSQSTENK